MSLFCAIAFCAKDTERVLDLLSWCVQLGRQQYPALLVVDPDVPYTDGLTARNLAASAFSSVEFALLPVHMEGWIRGSNALFTLAAKHAMERNAPFLFLEPDAVPLKAGWLDAIAQAYANCGQPFMGALVTHQQPGLPSPYLEGNAVYPANALSIVLPYIKDSQSWTLASAEAVVKQAVNSPLFRHLWGEKDKPPTFAERNVPGTNIYCLRQFPPEAVLFHRCKNGSLIQQLRQQKGLASPLKPVMVLPFCNMDAALFLRNLHWQAQLGEHYHCEAILSYDTSTAKNFVETMSQAASGLFDRVIRVNYRPPQRGQWPPTIAFIAAATVAARHGTPWFWHEYDMIPLKRGWFDVLWTEYQICGKPFMGPVVQGMGHMNGTGFYPADTPARIPKALANLITAWDYSMKPEMIHDCHDCIHLLQHVWIMDRSGRFQPHGDGRSPTFKDHATMRQITPSAVAFHRCKDGTLIDRLREKL